MRTNTTRSRGSPAGHRRLELPTGAIFFVVLIALMWLLLVRPQRRRQLDQQRLWASAEPGDEIVTAGGIYGRITTAVDDNDVMVEIAEGLEVKIARRAIAGVFRDEPEDEEDEPEDGENPSAETAETGQRG